MSIYTIDVDEVIAALESLPLLYKTKKEVGEAANEIISTPLSYSGYKHLWQSNAKVNAIIESLLIKNNNAQQASLLSSDTEYCWETYQEDTEYVPIIQGVTASSQIPDPLTTYQKMMQYYDKADDLNNRKRNQIITFDGGPICLVNIADIHFGGAVDVKRVFEDIELINNTPRMYINFLGDLSNNFIGAWTRKINHNSQFTIEEEHAISRYYIQQISKRLIAFTSGNHDCLDPLTECMTKRGWLYYKDLNLDDQVLSYIAETDTMEWSKINEIVEFDFDGELNVIAGKNINLAVTDNHRILHQRRIGSRNWTDFQYSSMFKLCGDNAFIAVPTTRLLEASGYDISDDELYIVSWLLLSSSLYANKLALSQRISNFHKINNALVKANVSFEVIHNDLQPQVRDHEVIFVFSQEYSDYILSKYDVLNNRFPDWVWKLSYKQFEILFDVFVDAQGKRIKGYETVCSFYSDKPVCDEFQILCLLNGRGASIYQYDDNTKNLHYRVDVNIARPDVSLAIDEFLTRVPYIGKVWCLRVPHGNFMIRRNGKPCFTGNSWSIHEAGIDVMKTYLNEIGSPAIYDAYENVFALNVDGRETVVRTRHQWLGSSQYNDTHAIEKAAKFDQAIPFDIGVGGHTHRSGLYREFNNGGKTGVAILCGTYKRYDDFAKEIGFPSSNKSTAVCVILDPNSESGYHGISDIHSAAKYMQYITKK